MTEQDVASRWHPAELTDGWVRPSARFPAEPRWGHPDGVQVGLHPLPGPRGLLRIYTPYLGHAPDRVVNFVAVEPIPSGQTARGYSELEPSALDGAPGKRFVSSDSTDADEPADSTRPSRGVVETVDGVEQLRAYIRIERFDNGAHVDVRVSFRRDRPHEIALAAFAREDSVPLDYCILTATMGNYARLRQVRLADRTVTPAELWPGFAGDGFAAHAVFPLTELARDPAGDVVLEAMSDETDAVAAEYADGTPEHWKYYGRAAKQTWIAAAPDARLEARVNARRVYWAGTVPIPGGPAFENVELVEPFVPGREFIFRVDPVSA